MSVMFCNIVHCVTEKIVDVGLDEASFKVGGFGNFGGNFGLKVCNQGFNSVGQSRKFRCLLDSRSGTKFKLDAGRLWNVAITS